MSTRVCILDYGSGNVRSVYNLFCLMSGDVKVSNDPDVLRNASHLILPGVGAFGASMEKIRNRLPVDLLVDEVLRKGKPFLGICVGMQVLASKGYEFGEHAGLGWIEGVVCRLKTGGLLLPHIGWNNVAPIGTPALFQGFDTTWDFYFLHSFAFADISAVNVGGITEYGQTFPSVVHKENIWGVQFHPEKSQKTGRRLVKNFLEISV